MRLVRLFILELTGARSDTILPSCSHGVLITDGRAPTVIR